MIQRLFVPLAFRSLLLSIVVAGIASIFIAPMRLLHGDQIMSATLRDVSAGVSWSGTSLISASAFDPKTCQQAQTCDIFTLKLEVSNEYRKFHPDFAVAIRLDWDDPQNDFDLYLSKDGHTMENSSQGQTNAEELRLNHPANGIYHVFTHAASIVPQTPYNGRVRLLPSPQNPPPRSARYQKDPDGKFGPAVLQFAPELDVERIEKSEGLRTDIEIDPFGSVYVAADGSDLTVGDPQVTLGKLYVHERPEWAVAVGSSRLYVTSPKDSDLVLRRSADGGRTFTTSTVITHLWDTTAGTGQGNLITDRNGTILNVFTGSSRNEIYLARSIEPCEKFVARRIFIGGPGVTVNHPYPVLALDRAGGLHVVFSDGTAVYLISSADGGMTWKDPVQVNDRTDPETPSASSPWVFAGDSGRVGITWIGIAGDAFYAFTPDAFASVPTFSYVQIGDAQANANLPSGAVDPFGNANLVYGHTRVLRQIGGERFLFGPFVTAAGNLQTESGVKHISLNVRQDFSGNVTFLDEQRKLSLKSVQFTSSKRMDQKIAVSGRGKLQDGTPVTFTLVTGDPQGSDKDFSISISNGYFAAGILQNTASMETKVQKALRNDKKMNSGGPN